MFPARTDAFKPGFPGDSSSGEIRTGGRDNSPFDSENGSIVVTSMNGADHTIIDGDGLGSVVTLRLRASPWGMHCGSAWTGSCVPWSARVTSWPGRCAVIPTPKPGQSSAICSKHRQTSKSMSIRFKFASIDEPTCQSLQPLTYWMNRSWYHGGGTGHFG